MEVVSDGAASRKRVSRDESVDVTGPTNEAKRQITEKKITEPPGRVSEEAQPTEQEKIKSTISQHKVVVFSKMWCPFCAKAKNAIFSVLSEDSPHVKIIELEDENKKQLLDAPAYQAAFNDMFGSKSVPKVFFGGQFMGGGDQIVELKSNGSLRQKLINVGALVETKQDAASLNLRYFLNGQRVDQDFKPVF